MFAAWWACAGAILRVYGPSWEMLTLSVAVLIGSGVCVATSARQHPFALALFLLVSPLIVWPASVAAPAASGYFRGTAYIHVGGLRSELANVDSHSGVPQKLTYGCVTDPVHEMEVAIHNATVRLLVRTLGPMNDTASRESVMSTEH